MEDGSGPDERAQEDDFVAFYQDVFNEVSKYGPVDVLSVVENLGDHLLGNTYVRYLDDRCAAEAVEGLKGKYFHGYPVRAELCPVVNFAEARCRNYEEGLCDRGGLCNFMHVRYVPVAIEDFLFNTQLHPLPRRAPPPPEPRYEESRGRYYEDERRRY